MDRILFYDGNCGICTRSVRFLMNHDPHQRLRFAPLQGETAQSLLSEGLRKDLSTAVYRESEEVTHLRSDAALRALIDTGCRWRFMAKASLWVPKGLRDVCYNWVAQNRKRLSPKGSCPMPTEKQRKQLLP